MRSTRSTTMGPTALARRRLLNDLAEFRRQSPPGMAIHSDDSNLMEIWAVLIGPSETPYQGGFYHFHLRFPDDYPFNPPTVTFLTHHPTRSVRFHPNLYESGKVCLSMLNTWHGPGWSSVQTLTSVLCTIQSILDEWPLHNEPSHEHDPKSHPDQINYNRQIEIANLETVAETVRTATTGPVTFRPFAAMIQEYYRSHYEEYRTLLQKYQARDGPLCVLRSPRCYAMSTATVLYTTVATALREAYQTVLATDIRVRPQN